MNRGWRASMLRGRDRERAALDRLLAGARAGRSGALVLRGEPGIGKTALLDYAVAQAGAMRVARAAGVEPEVELPFAGLHQLCGGMLDHMDKLPAPQEAALAAALGLSGARAPDRLLVGLAVLGLLAEVAAEQPLLCVVDDAGWLDRASAQALAFAARRLATEPIALAFAAREPVGELAGLEVLTVEGLSDAESRALLASSLHGTLDEQVRERLLAEAQGNPLALTELPRAMAPGELAGGYGLPHAAQLSRRLEESFVRRFERLPPATRTLLLVAAAEPVGEPMLLWRAAAQLGIDRGAGAEAEAEDLLRIGARVTFRHPLVRSAVYRAAGADQRRAAHAALAAATDAEVDPDRRAWHLAQAARGPDAALASELEASASRARRRGGLAAAAAFLEAAARLTPDPGRRALRGVVAAQAMFAAGATDAALAQLLKAQPGPLRERDRARLARLRGEIVFAQTRGGDAPALLLAAAEQFAPLDARRAREAYLEAIATAAFRGGEPPLEHVRAAAEAARAAPPAPEPVRIVDELLDGLAVRWTDGFAAAAPLLARALERARGETAWSARAVLWMWIMCRVAADHWDAETADAVSLRVIALARADGALAVLSPALAHRALSHVLAGRLVRADQLIAEADALIEATGNAPFPYAAVILAGWRGEPDALERIRGRTDEAIAQGDGMAGTAAAVATAIFHNGMGGYEDALRAAERAAGVDRLGLASWGDPELIEAAVRTGRRAAAERAFERLVERTQAAGTALALGVEARSRALLSDDAEAEAFYLEAIALLRDPLVAIQHARTQLLYGEWLRRARRRVEAREQLRSAHEQLRAMGAVAFAARAAGELAATGERARARSADTRDQLTPHELTIARLARDGRTNQEIGAQLFISPRTVEYHLYKVFRKLDISSRLQLAHALPADAGES
jgi:DNA-binding CsgD family transcriptional regulator